jgi:hypothetical protein
MIVRAKGIKQGNTIVLNESLAIPDQEVEIIVITQVKDDHNQEQKPTLATFFGKLKNSPSFSGDPVLIQRQMRDEWN